MKVPLYQPRVGVPRLREQVNPEAAQLGAIARFGETVSTIGADVATRIAGAIKSKEINKALTDAKESWYDFARELETDNDYLGYEKKFNEYKQKLQETLTTEMKLPGSRRAFNERFESWAVDRQEDIAQLSRQKFLADARSSFLRDVSQDVRDLDEDALNTRIDEAVADGIIDPTDGEEIRQSEGLKIRMDRVRNIARQYGYEDGIAELNKNRDYYRKTWNLSNDEMDQVISDLQFEQRAQEAQDTKEWEALNEKDWRRAQLDRIEGRITDPRVLYDTSQYNLTVPQANAIVADIERNNRNLQKQILEGIKDKTDDAQERYEAELAIRRLNFQLTEGDVNNVKKHFPDRTEHWAKELASQRRELEAMGKDKADALEEENYWWLETSDEFKRLYVEKKYDPEIDALQLRQWLRDNLNDPENPWDEAMTPRIGIKEYDTWMNQVDRVKDIAPFLRVVTEDMEAEFDDDIDREGNVTKRAKLTEEKEKTLQEFMQKAVDEDWDQAAIEGARLNVMKPVRERKAKHALKQLNKWAREGRIDEYGRLIGLAELETLEALNIESFADIDLDDEKQIEKLKEAGVDVTKTPPKIESEQWEYVRDPNGQYYMARDAEGYQIVHIKNAQTNETRWVRTGWKYEEDSETGELKAYWVGQEPQPETKKKVIDLEGIELNE